MHKREIYFHNHDVSGSSEENEERIKRGIKRKKIEKGEKERRKKNKKKEIFKKGEKS